MANNQPLPVEETIGLVRDLFTPDFLLRRWFPEVGITGTQATWTVFPNVRTKGKYVPFGAPARVVARKGMHHLSFRMTHFREKKLIQATAKYDRRPGGNANEAWPLSEQIADELAALNDELQYTKEWERAQILFGGLASLAYDDGTVELVDYLTSTATHFGAVASVWSGEGADILGDVSSRVSAIEQDCGKPPVVMLGGAGLYIKLIKNTVLQNYMKESPDGIRAIYENRWPRLLGMDVIEYRQGYLSDAGAFTPYVPAGYVTFFADPSALGMQMLQGEAVEVEAAGNPGTFAKTYIEEDPSGLHGLVDDVSLPLVQVPRGIATATGT